MDIAELTQSNMLDYAGAVNQARAIPDARTGLKPIHRKILYEMYVDKITSKNKYKKNAYMVGQIIARFSEHGDAGTYGALVRLGQDWIQRYPLLDFHGNSGSQFGDPSAAMRYTESRLSGLAEEGFLSNLHKENVDWIPNFTNEEYEPSTLPAIFPGLFCLPSQGIGYACACNFLTMNLKEVGEGLIQYMNKGTFPILQYDLASGGTIINPDIMKQIYKTGKGTVIIESKYHIEKNKIHITEIPFNVMFDDLMEEIVKIGESDDNPGFIDVQNNSGDGKLEMIIEATSAAKVEYVLNYLLDKTKLRSNFSINQIALVDNQPKILTQPDMAKIYVKHNTECIKREFIYDNNKALARIHILEGLLKAFANIDDIIKIIRNSDNIIKAKQLLQQKYSFDDLQVQAILNMKLSKLSKLDGIELNNELKEKQEFVKYAEKVINNIDEQKSILIKRLSNLIEKYGDKRRTEVVQKTITKVSTTKAAKEEAVENVVITFNPLGYLQNIPLAAYRKNSFDAFKITTKDFVLLFSNQGRFFRISPKDVKSCSPRDKGTAIGAILSLEKGEKIIAAFDSIINEKRPYILFAMENGYVKKTEKAEYIGTTRNIKGMVATKLKDYEIVSIQETNGNDIMLTSKDGYRIRFHADEVRASGKASLGVIGIKLGANDAVVDAKILEKTDKTDIALTKRAGKGKKK